MKKIIDFMLTKERLWFLILLLSLIPLVNIGLEFMNIREADSLQQQAISLIDKGNFEQAIALSNDAILLVTNKFGEESTAVASALTALGKIYVRQGIVEHVANRHESAQSLFAQAVTLYERALKIRMAKYGADDKKVEEISSLLNTVNQFIKEDREVANIEVAGKISNTSINVKH